MPTGHELPKESGGKKKFWNKRKGKPSQYPSKKQQTVAVYVAIIPAAVPATQAPASRYAGTLPRWKNVTSIITDLYVTCNAPTVAERGTQPVFAKHKSNQPIRLLELE